MASRKSDTSIEKKAQAELNVWDSDESFGSVSKTFELGRPTLSTTGPVNALTWPDVPMTPNGPCRLMSAMLKIWADSRYTFYWDVWNKSRHRQHYFSVDIFFAYNDSLHSPIRELDWLNLMYARFADGERAKRTVRQYNQNFETYFSWLGRSDISCMMRLLTAARK